MCSGSEAGSYLRLIDSCITQLKAQGPSRTCNESKEEEEDKTVTAGGGQDELFDAAFSNYFFFFFTLVTGPRRCLSLKLSDTRVYEPSIRTHSRYGCHAERRGENAPGNSQQDHTAT